MKFLLIDDNLGKAWQLTAANEGYEGPKQAAL